ncbi:MAG: hypothetical protein ACR2PD_10365 [Luminiphilus sp.]
MTDNRYLRAYAVLALGLLLLCGLVLNLGDRHGQVLMGESGPIEVASAVGYFACALYMIARGGRDFLVSRGYFVVLTLLFGFRELDFDKAFTTMGILKSRFYLSSDVPIPEKVIGLLVIALIFWTVFQLLRNHFVEFLQGLKQRAPVALGVGLIFFLLAFSKSIDGLARKLKPFGIETSAEVSRWAGSVEEVLELGIPIYMVLTFHAWLSRRRAESPSSA